MKITDEMIKMFGDAWEAADVARSKGANLKPGSKRRAGLEAVLPLIEAEIALVFAEEIGRLECHLGFVEEILDQSLGELDDGDWAELNAVINAWREGR